MTNYLFPSSYKKIGWLLLLPSAIFGLLSLITNYEPEILNINLPTPINIEIMGETKYFIWINNNILNEIFGVLIIVGLLLVAFSKEKNEDEYISKIRLESLVRAVYVNYIILILSFLFIFQLTFLWVMMLNMFTVLIFFVLQFNWQISKLNRGSKDEE